MYPQRHLPIVIALLASITLISVALLFKKDKEVDVSTETDASEPSPFDVIPGVQQDDHILGNPNADLVFIVYTDFSCPYCKEYHQTMRTIINMYGKQGQVAVVYRHVPFVQLHPEAPMYALASECVARDKGNAGFWDFTDLMFERGDPINPMTPADVVLLAEQVGVSRQGFVACMRSNELMARVEEDFNEIVGAGAKGSPYTIMMMDDMRNVYQGAQPFQTIALAVQNTLRSRGVETLTPPSSATSKENQFFNDFEGLDATSTTATTSSTTASSVPVESDTNLPLFGRDVQN